MGANIFMFTVNALSKVMINAPVYKWCLFRIAPNIKLFTQTYWILQMKIANGKIGTKMHCLHVFIEILRIQMVFNIIWIVYYSKQKLTNVNLYALTNISYTNKKGIQLSNNVQGNFDTRKNLLYFLYLNNNRKRIILLFSETVSTLYAISWLHFNFQHSSTCFSNNCMTM